ncbi:MAG TPA: hypothetical protein PKY95_09225, partial [candidate division Zixibacteria bacterium]|nr:hypothetical protein [candidate division Zixibacteria bacterium]
MRLLTTRRFFATLAIIGAYIVYSLAFGSAAGAQGDQNPPAAQAATGAEQPAAPGPAAGVPVAH